MRKQNFFKHLDACAINWDYFTNFNTLSKLEVFKNEILALEPLLVSNENEIEDKLVSIVSLYPKSVDVLLLMIAIRRNKLSQLKIESSAELGFKYDKLLSDTIDYDELLAFFRESGLKELFLSRKIVHLKSYLMGAEIGLDSNARKNRSGNLMANKCESILENYCNHNRFKGYRETTLKRYGINLDKQFDYLIEHPSGIMVFEFNLYNSSGSKIKSVSKEYQKLQTTLAQYDVIFIWVTSGEAWIQNRKIAESNLENIPHFINYHQLKTGYIPLHFDGK